MDHLETSELAEAEAKFFAKYALAPPPLVHQLGLKDPYEIMARFDISLEAAFYAYNYYKKWLNYGGECYKAYERRLIRQFDSVM